VAHRRLLVVENAQPEVRSPGAKIVENGCEMSELGANGGLGHGGIPRTVQDNA
jgi:hypothetical protein